MQLKDVVDWPNNQALNKQQTLKPYQKFKLGMRLWMQHMLLRWIASYRWQEAVSCVCRMQPQSTGSETAR